MRNTTTIKNAFIIISSFFLCLPAVAEEKFSINGDSLAYNTNPDGEIEWKDVEELRAVLLDNSKITKLVLSSDGGNIYAAREMADIIIDFDLDTHVVGECASACTYLFLAGNKRTIRRGSKMGFHQSYWDAANIEEFYNDWKEKVGWENPYEFASWLHEDTQRDVLIDLEYYLERGVDGKFAIKTLQAASDEMWYPRRTELERAGVLTD